MKYLNGLNLIRSDTNATVLNNKYMIAIVNTKKRDKLLNVKKPE